MQISDMIPGVNIIGGKVSAAIVIRDVGSWGVLRPQIRGGDREWSTLRKFLDSKEHLDWLEIDLNVAEIIPAQYYKHKKTYCE